MVKVSPEATAKLKEALTAQGRADLAVRVYVKPGGCSGISYGMGLDESKPGDQSYDHEGLKILVDPFSAQYLEGAEVDYQDETQGGGFTILNPKASDGCGCGTSCGSSEEEEEGHAHGGCGCGSGGCC